MTDTSAYPGINVDSILAASNAAPGLDPQSAYGIGQTTSDASLAAENAQGTSAMAQGQVFVNTLKQHDAATQKKIWDSSPDSLKAMATAAGYGGPPKQSHESFFNKAVGAVGGVVASGLGTVADTAKSDVSGALHVLGTPLRAVQHLYRSGSYLADQEKADGDSFWGTFTDPRTWSLSDYAKAYSATEHGERTFLPTRVAQLTQKYGPDTVNLAKQLAGGTSPDQLIQSQPDDVSKQALATRINTDQDLRHAVSELNNAKISFGRDLVGQSLFQSNPALASKLSGAVDMVADVMADPVVVGGKLAKATEMAPYIVGDGARVAEVLDKPGAQRLLKVAGDALAEPSEAGGPNVGALTRKLPQFSSVAQQLSDAGVSNADDLKTWLTSNAGVSAIMDGRVSGVATHNLAGEALVPFLSKRGAAAIPVKAALGDAIDWAAEHHIPLAKSLDRITMLRVPAGEKLSADSDQAITYVRRLSEYALGGVDSEGNKITSQVVDDLVNKWAADPTYETYKGLLKTVMDGMKVDPDYQNQFFHGVENGMSAHTYGIGDELPINGMPTSTGFTVNHVMDDGWAIPEFRALRMAADKGFIVDGAYGGINGDKMSWFMNTWKPAQLLRIGFPIRAAGEELAAAMLREGPIPLLRARLATSSLKDGEPLAAVHPFANILDRLTNHLPDSVANAINTPRDLAGEVIGDTTRRAFRYVEGRLAGQRYVDAAKRVFDVWPDSFNEMVGATEQRGAGFLDDAKTVTQMTRDGRLVKPAQLVPGDTYADYTPHENLYTRIWQKNLQEYSQDPLTRAALGAVDQGEEAQIQAVVDKLGEPGQRLAGAKAARSRVTSDGRLVGDGATQDEALRDWATVVVKNANHMVTDSSGQRFDDLYNLVNAGKTPEIDALNSIPAELRPATQTGPDMLPVQGANKWQEIQQNGFGYIGKMMNWISREPMFVHNMATSMAEVEKLRDVYMASLAAEGIDATPEHIEQQLSELAFQRSLNKTIPFIHDPAVRSQFAEDARNISPFMFAQEQFFKRWANTSIHSPEAFREAQLSMNGLRNIGFIHKDPQTGQEYFNYPGAGMVQRLLTDTWGKLTGQNVTLPIPVGFSGQVQFATPGTERIGAPSFGPLVAVPMRALTQRFPELAQMEQAVVGPRGAGRPYWEDIAPASLTRVIHAIIDNPDDVGSQMHSAAMQAIQYLEATGNGLPDNADSLEQTRWQDRVKSWTRIMMFTRAIYGFAAPASPNVSFDPKNLHAEFSQLVGEMPIGDATKEFMRRHPDATPYTVFQSKSQSGAPLPATDAVASFMGQHEDFLKTYPQASAWFLPQAPKGDQTQFSMAAYREQLALGLRDKKSLDEFYKDIKFSEAATDYFDTKDGRDKRLAAAKAAGDSAATAQINQQWDQWSAPYLAAHPIFRDQLESSTGQIRRQDTVEQLRQAIKDPNLPSSPQTAAIADMVDTYDGLQSRLAPFKGLRDSGSTAARKEMTAQFVDWAHSYTKDHPEVEGLYNSVFRLLVGDQQTVNG